MEIYIKVWTNELVIQFNRLQLATIFFGSLGSAQFKENNEMRLIIMVTVLMAASKFYSFSAYLFQSYDSITLSVWS